MSSTSIRPATLDDLKTLLDLMVAFNAIEQIRWQRSRGEAAVRALISDETIGLVELIEEDGRIVGYFILTWGFDLEWYGRDAVLTELFLAEDVRGRGLGTFALREAERLAAARGARALHLLVREENRRARRLYASSGFVAPGRIFLTKSLSRNDARLPVTSD
jgi:ribosomal protein S18 acetylase RimI-like enzyme